MHRQVLQVFEGQELVSFDGDRFEYKEWHNRYAFNGDSLITALNVGALNLKNISVRGLRDYSFLIAFDTLVHAEGCHFSHLDANVGSAILFQQFAELSQLQTLHVTNCVFEHISAEISAGAIFISSEQ